VDWGAAAPVQRPPASGGLQRVECSGVKHGRDETRERERERGGDKGKGDFWGEESIGSFVGQTKICERAR